MLLTRDQILQAEDLPCEIVKVPEWGGEVKIKTLTGKERDKFEATTLFGDSTGVDKKSTKHDLTNFRARLVAATAIDEDGKFLFPSSEDVVALGNKSASALDRCFEVAQRLSGLTNRDVEELTKNLETGLSENSISD